MLLQTIVLESYLWSILSDMIITFYSCHLAFILWVRARYFVVFSVRFLLMLASAMSIADDIFPTLSISARSYSTIGILLLVQLLVVRTCSKVFVVHSPLCVVFYNVLTPKLYTPVTICIVSTFVPYNLHIQL